MKFVGLFLLPISLSTGQEERRKKETLLQKREEAKHGKTAKAMANRTKDNLQYYTKEKLNRFVAAEKEREQKQREKEERKYQKRLEKERRAQEGTKRKRRSKLEIAKDKGQVIELPKPTVGVKVERKEKPTPPPKQAKNPPLDFNALLKLANEKQKNAGEVGVSAEFHQLKTGRPMTQEEKDRWQRLHTKKYQDFLKKGGKRPEFPGTKKGEGSSCENSSRESSLEPKSSGKNTSKCNDVPKKHAQNVLSKSNDMKIKSNENNRVPCKKSVTNGDPSGAPRASDKWKHKKQEQSSRQDVPSSPELEVHETVIQCGPARSKPGPKRKSEEPRVNPFDRIIQRFDMHRPPPGNQFGFGNHLDKVG